MAWLFLGAHFLMGANHVTDIASFVLLIATVFGAVFHAEVIAHRVGEPFGTLVLAIAVTIIEAALIISMMITGGGDETLARDTVFAAVMIVCNGIMGLCLLAGGIRHREQGFQLQGATSALAVLAAVTVLSLILPNFTISSPGPTFNTPQLIFAGIVSVVLYALFVFIQTVRHREYFLSDGPSDDDPHVAQPSKQATIFSFLILLVSLAAVVGVAESLTPAFETAVDRFGAPKGVVGIIIAGLTLMPEGLAAFRAARANRLQTSLNLALGSALASICLTIPTVAATSLILRRPLALGLGPKEEVQLALTLLLSTITLGTGRTTVLQGTVHLVVFGAFVFVAFIP